MIFVMFGIGRWLRLMETTILKRLLPAKACIWRKNYQLSLRSLHSITSNVFVHTHSILTKTAPQLFKCISAAQANETISIPTETVITRIVTDVLNGKVFDAFGQVLSVDEAGNYSKILRVE